MKKIVLICILLTTFAVQAETEKHLIYVNGVAEKIVDPNMLMVRIESWAKASSAQKAQEQQASQFAKVKAAVEKFKVKKEDIQTEGFNVYPEYFYDQKNQVNRITGYRVSHTFMIIYRKVEDAGNFLDDLVTSKSDSSGISVNSISWDSDKKAQAEISTLADAVKNARQKANELAAAAGVSIKAVHKIQHSSYSPPVAQPVFEKMSMMADSARGASTEVSSGQIKVRVEVQMEFEI